jgi:hypothetical protein
MRKAAAFLRDALNGREGHQDRTCSNMGTKQYETSQLSMEIRPGQARNWGDAGVNPSCRPWPMVRPSAFAPALPTPASDRGAPVFAIHLRRLRLTPFRRAASEMFASASAFSTTIRAFSASLQFPRRRPPVITSTASDQSVGSKDRGALPLSRSGQTMHVSDDASLPSESFSAIWRHTRPPRALSPSLRCRQKVRSA